MGTFFFILFIVFILCLIFGKKQKVHTSTIKSAYTPEQTESKNHVLNGLEKNDKAKQISLPSEEKTIPSSSTSYLPEDIKTKSISFVVKPIKKEVQSKAKEQEEEVVSISEIIAALVKNTSITVNEEEKQEVKSELHDDSIVDVSGEGIQLAKLRPENELEVPVWHHRYIYSYDEISSATKVQKAFYQKFKTHFLKGDYLDVGGNSNYYFILLYDLLRGSDLQEIEQQLKALSKHYPKTASYAKNLFVQKLQRSGVDSITAWRASEEAFGPYIIDYSYVRLGSKYKDKLKLSEREVQLMNKLWDPANNFSGIEFCLVQMIKLYLRSISELERECADKNTTLTNELDFIADQIVRKVLHYKKGSYNYKYAIESTANELYILLFKYCENALRDHYGHKRKISTDCTYPIAIKNELEIRVLSKLPAIFAKALTSVEQPDRTTEMLLNEQNTTRWKTSFEKLTANFTEKSVNEFLPAVIALGDLNKKNPSIEHIFYEASKFVAKWDRKIALTLYIHYIYHDMNSDSFDQKPFTKTIQKSLFKTSGELEQFEQIVQNLIRDKDLKSALSSVAQVYIPKRKTIQLNQEIISEVRKQHRNTVEILDEILAEDLENVPTAVTGNIEKAEEIQFAIKTNEILGVNVLTTELNPVQSELIELFYKSSFVVSQDEVEQFARVKNLFQSGLIESINDAFYEKLDDLLIEEEDENYIMNESYYSKITEK